jgi:hypothetical protein
MRPMKPARRYWHWSHEAELDESHGESGLPSVVDRVAPWLGQFCTPPHAPGPVHVMSHLHELVQVTMPLHAPEVWQSI